MEDRIAIGRKFMVGINFPSLFYFILFFISDTKKNEFRKMSDEIPMELSLQMGRYVLLSTLWVKSTHFMKAHQTGAGRDSWIFGES